MTKAQLRRLFRRHPGSMAEVARELGITRQTVSGWFRGMTISESIERAVRARAQELIAKENSAKETLQHAS